MIIYKQQTDLKEGFTLTVPERAVHKSVQVWTDSVFKTTVQTVQTLSLSPSYCWDACITAMSLGVSLARCSVVMRCIFPHGCCSVTESCPVVPEVMSWSVHFALKHFVTKPPHTQQLTDCSINAQLLLSYSSLTAQFLLSYSLLTAKLQRTYYSVTAPLLLSNSSLTAQLQLTYC